MGSAEFMKAVLDMRTALLNAKQKGVSLDRPVSRAKVYDFNASKEESYRRAVQIAYDQIRKNYNSLSELSAAYPENMPIVDRIKPLVAELDIPEKRDRNTAKIIELFSMLKIPEERRIPKQISIPYEIKDEVSADLSEMQKAFSSGCYRSVAILCGRILEVILHRKYFDATGDDLLEKAPGIGLGKIVAKLSEKSISLDPGIMQQIHLINNVRVSSVHAKKELFSPSRHQAEAMMLYTSDILEKIFHKNDKA